MWEAGGVWVVTDEIHLAFSWVSLKKRNIIKAIINFYDEKTGLNSEHL